MRHPKHETPFVIGFDADGEAIHAPGERHFICFARTAAGKGTGIIVPNLIEYPGSVFCTDPNGENANITASASAAKGYKAVVLDPYRHTRGPATKFRATWNVVAELDPKSELFPEDIKAIGEGSIAPSPGSEHSNAAHFDSGARRMWGGVVAYVRLTEPPERQSLARAHELVLSRGRALFQEMKVNRDGYGAAADGAAQYLAAGDNEAGGFMSTLINGTEWIGASPLMKQQIADSTFKMDELHSGRVRLYIVLPASRGWLHASWMRLLFRWALQRLGDLQHTPTGSGHPVLFLLDEFGAIGQIDMLDRNVGQLRHFQVKLAPFLQGLDQLQRDYPRTWQSFIQNCMPCFFGINDLETAQYISNYLGETRYYEEKPPQTSINFQDQNELSGSVGVGPELRKEALWTPGDVMRELEPDARRMVLFTPRPALLDRIPYFERYEEGVDYDKNPKYA